MCDKCPHEMVKQSYEPDAERDALWRPVLWLRGSNHGYLHWLARIDWQRCGHHGRAYAPDASGKVWLSESMIPWMEERGLERLLVGCMDGEGSLSFLLAMPWNELEETIRRAGENPLTLPFDEFLPPALFREDMYRDRAFAWIEALPPEIATRESIRSALGTLKRQGNERAAAILAKQDLPDPAKWAPFHVMGLGSGWTLETPYPWRKLVIELVTHWGYTLEEILQSRLETKWDNLTFRLPDETESNGQTLGKWAEAEGVILITPELSLLTIDPRIELWRQMLRAELEKTKNGTTLFADEITRRTGHALPLEGFGLICSVLRPFKDHPTHEVYQHHSSGGPYPLKPEDIYLVIRSRVSPPGISQS